MRTKVLFLVASFVQLVYMSPGICFSQIKIGKGKKMEPHNYETEATRVKSTCIPSISDGEPVGSPPLCLVLWWPVVGEVNPSVSASASR